jgi:HAD superfamily hydrolase (TIGR01459 family)
LRISARVAPGKGAILTDNIKLISGLGEIAGEYDAIVCDVWGVVHDGAHAYPAACTALKTFREKFGRVVLLSNAPRPPADTARQLAGMGMPADCYDAIVTSGGASRDDIAARAARGRVKLLHIGPERDRPIYAGLDVELVGPEAAEAVLLTGLDDHDTETPDDYADVLKAVRQRDLTVICANPDILVPIGDKIVYCAGAVAREYEKLGGKVIYYGKPYLPVYDMALEAAAAKKRVLAIGDALETDIEGASRARLDALFVAGGLHARDVGELSENALTTFFAGKYANIRAGIAMLAW